MQELSLGDLLPAAVGIALSPIPIVAVILMLFSPRAKVNGPAFVVGWVLGLLIIGAALLTLGADSVGTEGAPSQVAYLVELLLGLLLLFGAFRQWRTFRTAGQEPAAPSWMKTIDGFSAGKSFLVGAALSGLNPKNLALNAAGVLVIAEAGLSQTDQWIALVVFVVLSSLTVALPVAVYFMGGDTAAARLDRAKTWLITHNSAVMAVVLLIFATKLLAEGAQGLLM